MKVLLNFHLARDVQLPVPREVLDTLRARFPAVEFVPADDAETLAREAVDADVFYGWRFPAELLPAAVRLRWIQTASAGTEGHPPGLLRARGIALTNAAGVAADVIAEHVLAVMLAFCRNLHVALRFQREGRWDRLGVLAGDGGPIRALSESTVAVLGLGPIGREVGVRAAAMGAIVRGCRRSPGAPVPAPWDAVVPPDRLHELLGWADFVVVALPHTPETEGMLGVRELEGMKDGAYLVNVARGAVVDERALVAVLEQRRLGGAALDVFVEEPLPASSPLWQLPNVILTPHVAGARPRYLERALDLFIDNLTRWLAGEPLRNLVDPVRGYPVTSR